MPAVEKRLEPEPVPFATASGLFNRPAVERIRGLDSFRVEAEAEAAAEAESDVEAEAWE
jgi:hypothetical protein